MLISNNNILVSVRKKMHKDSIEIQSPKIVYCPFDSNHKVKAIDMAKHWSECSIVRQRRASFLPVYHCPFSVMHGFLHKDEFTEHLDICSCKKDLLNDFKKPDELLEKIPPQGTPIKKDIEQRLHKRKQEFTTVKNSLTKAEHQNKERKIF